MKNKHDYKDYPEIVIIEDLKRILKEYSYAGIPLVNVYRTQFIGDYWSGNYTKNNVSKTKIIAVRIYLLLKLIIIRFKKKESYSFLEKSILIETFSSDIKLRGFWEPILKNNTDQNITLIHCNGIERYIKKTQPVIDTRLLHGKVSDVFKWFYMNKRILYEKIQTICNQYHLNKNSPGIILNTILATVVLIEQYKNLFKEHKPSCFLAIDDQHTNGAVICNILNLYNVPTFTQVHGAIGSQSMIFFTPINAQYVLTWGDYVRNLYINEGVPEKNVISVGCQRSNIEKMSLTKEEINAYKKIIGIPSKNLKKPVITFGFTALITDYWINDIKSLKKQLSKDYQLIGRLHPSQTMSNLSVYGLKSDDELILTESKQILLEHQILLSDIIIIDSSTLGFDALLKGKIVIVLDSGEELKSQAVMYDVLESNAAKLCRSSKDVVEFLNNKDQFEELKRNSEKFISQYIMKYGDDAAKEILKVVSKISSEQHKTLFQIKNTK